MRDGRSFSADGEWVGEMEVEGTSEVGVVEVNLGDRAECVGVVQRLRHL